MPTKSSLEKRAKAYRKASPLKLKKMLEGLIMDRKKTMTALSKVQDEERKLQQQVDKLEAQKRKFEAKVETLRDKRYELEGKLDDFQAEAELVAMYYEEAVSDEWKRRSI